jgi:RepB DNA-primase N-terminal domain
MNQGENVGPGEYILDAFEASNRIAVLALNRDLRETVQRLTIAGKAASPEFQAWLRYKNANGSDIYVGMNPLKPDAATRTKEDIDAIRHVYIDLDYGGQKALQAIHKSNAVPTANFVLTSSPGKFQVVWKVEGVTLNEAEALLRTLAREFGGDPAATDATRVLRLPGFANKKYATDFYVEARRHSGDTYHLRDFKLHIDGQVSLGHNAHTRTKREANHAPSQSERDWAFARRSLARGDDPAEVIREIALYRGRDKSNPEYYARLTVEKARADLNQKDAQKSAAATPTAEEIRMSQDRNERP